MLNKQGPGKIGWTTWSWNPISGCKHDCPYCYCNRLSKRWGRDFKEYVFRPEYYKDLKSEKLASSNRVFVGSSGDMFGKWVPYKHIELVLKAIKERPDVTFQFLTKNPKRYEKFEFSKNCWLGTSIDCWDRENIKRMYDFIDVTHKLKNIKFVSFEPLLGMIPASLLNIDWIIIGADSNAGADKPEMEWAEDLISEAQRQNVPVWIKDNFHVHTVIKNIPGGYNGLCNSKTCN